MQSICKLLVMMYIFLINIGIELKIQNMGDHYFKELKDLRKL